MAKDDCTTTDLRICEADLALCRKHLAEALETIDALEPLARRYLTDFLTPKAKQWLRLIASRGPGGKVAYDWGEMATQAYIFREFYADLETGRPPSWGTTWVYCQHILGVEKVPPTVAAFKKGVQRYAK